MSNIWDEEEEDVVVRRTPTYDPIFAKAMKEKALTNQTIDQIWLQKKIEQASMENEESEESPERHRSIPTKLTPPSAQPVAEEEVEDKEEETDRPLVNRQDFYKKRDYWPMKPVSEEIMLPIESEQAPAAAAPQSVSMEEKCKQVIGRMRALTSKYEADLASLQAELSSSQNGGRRSRKLVRRQKKKVSRK